MKNLFRKLAITLSLVMTFALCFAFVGCGKNEEDMKTERIYELVLDVAYKFKNPSSVRIISGKVN